MTDPALAPGGVSGSQSKSRLLTSMRQSFGAGGSNFQDTTAQLPASSLPPTQLSQVPQKSKPAVDQNQALDVLNQVISEVEAKGTAVADAQPPQVNPQELLQQAQAAQATRAVTESLQPVASAAPQVIAQATDTLNPNYAAGSAKERFDAGVATEIGQADTEQAIGDVTHVETEQTPEISPEVEAYLQKVQDHSNQIPDEIVLADNGHEIVTRPHIAQPVIVLPITEEEEKAGERKNPKFSVRWLVEWSQKIMKMFSGKVIYRQVPSNQEA